MKKLFILLFLFPLVLEAQNTNVRSVVSGNNVLYYRGTTPLYVKSIGITNTELSAIIDPSTVNEIYYVSNNGDDDNDGLTPATTWAHHPWMSTWTGSVTLEAGDVVCMKRGDTWTIASPVAPYLTVGQSGSEGQYIVTTAYGIGNKPILDVSTNTNQAVIKSVGKSFLIFNNLEITHYSSTYAANDEQCALRLSGESHDIIVTDCKIHDIPYIAIYSLTNAYNITIGDSLATETATVDRFSNEIYDWGYAGVLIQGTNSSTLISNFKIYHNYIHDCTRTGVSENAYGISLTATETSTAWPKYCYVRYNRVENIKTWSAISSHGGVYMYFQYNYVKNFGGSGINMHSSVVGALEPTCDTVFIENNIAENTEGGYTTGGENAFFDSYGVDGDSATYIFIRDNTCFYTERLTTGNLFNAISVSYCDNVIISGNHVYNGATTDSNYPGVALTGSAVKYDVTVEDNFIEDWGTGMSIRASSILGTLNIRNNIVVNSLTDPNIYLSYELPAGAIVNIYNNTLIGGSHGVYLTDVAGTINIKNNIIGTKAAGAIYYIRQGTITGTLAIDYNQYWNANASYFYAASDPRDWAYWTGTLGHDANSPNVVHGDADYDPLLKNLTTTWTLESDFDLQTTSPCINAGVDVSIDYLGTAPDIGYIEKR